MNLPEGTQGIMGVLLEMFEAGTYAREEKENAEKDGGSERERSKSESKRRHLIVRHTALKSHSYIIKRRTK